MLRRNKTQKACEPCRLSKVRCDHRTPKCERCQRRGITDQCTYHPSPLTKKREKIQQHRIDTAQNAWRTPWYGSAGSPVPQEPVPQVARRLTPVAVGDSPEDDPPTPYQYLGSTSVASLFAENHSIQSMRNVAPGRPPSAILGIYRSPHESELLEKIRSISLYKTLITVYNERGIFIVVPRPIIRSLLDHVEKRISGIDEIGKEAFLTIMIHETVSRFTIPDSTTAQNFHELCTGERLRWEVIGYIFTLAGCAVLTSPSDLINPILEAAGLEYSKFVTDMAWASHICIEICQQNGALNDILLWLTWQNNVLISFHIGEFSHFVWRKSGDVASDVFAMGMHRLPGATTPIWLSETRKRIFSSMYRSDKNLAIALGRPPRILKAYCDAQPPLDLDDEIFMAEDAELKSAIAALDNQGWGPPVAPGAAVRAASIIRLRYQLSTLREEILELWISNNHSGTEGRVRDLLARCQDLWDSWPSRLKYSPSIWQQYSSPSSLTLFVVYLEYTNCHFFLQRLLCRMNGEKITSLALLEVSFNIVVALNEATHQKCRYSEMEKHFTWMLLFYGIPSVAVLVTELRSCTITGRPLPNVISRADLIRNLALSLAALEWVSVPISSDYKTCVEITRVMSHMLDEVLNHEQVGNGISSRETFRQITFPQNPTATDEMGLLSFDGFDDVPNGGEEFLAFLESVDWPATLPPC